MIIIDLSHFIYDYKKISNISCFGFCLLSSDLRDGTFIMRWRGVGYFFFFFFFFFGGGVITW